MRWLDSVTNSMAMNLSKLRATVEDTGNYRAAVPAEAESDTNEQLNWTEEQVISYFCFLTGL